MPPDLQRRDHPQIQSRHGLITVFSCIPIPHFPDSDSLPPSFPDIRPPIFIPISPLSFFLLRKSKRAFHSSSPSSPPSSALVSGRRFIISNQPIVVSPHRLIKGHSPKVSSFTPPIIHVAETYDCIQRGFAPSSWLRAILAHIHHHHF